MINRRSTKNEPAAARTVDPCPLMLAYPLLADHLMQDRWPDGKPRLTSTLLVCSEDGVVKGWFHDRAEALSAWLAADSLSGLLDALEAGLRDDTIRWRADKKK